MRVSESHIKILPAVGIGENVFRMSSNCKPLLSVSELSLSVYSI